MTERQTGKHKQRPPTYITRRKALLAIGGAASAGALLSCGGGSDDTTASSSSTTSSTSSTAATTTTTASTGSSTCAVTPEGEIGPYFVDDSATGFDRSDIRSNLDTTIFPGWYAGRTTHIHLRVRSKYSEASSTSDGTNTTQVFFPRHDQFTYYR